MKANITIFLCLFLFIKINAQCPTCGNGVVDAGETNLNCPQDVPHGATATSPCAAPGSFESAVGIRYSYDFSGTTTWSTSGLPSGWTFAGAPTSLTAGALPAVDTYGAKAGLIQPNCSGSCTGTNGFCIGNIANLQSTGSQKLGGNFDGRANVSQNLSYAVLRGQGNPTLVSETFNFSGVESFKIQLWLNASETSCGQSNAWGSCVGNTAYLDFSSDGGTSWTQILTLNNSSTNSDMATSSMNNTFYIQEGTWSRLCLTVFKNGTSPGNFYSENNSTLTAPTGIMTNNAYFTSTFKFRIRYSQTASCTSGISATNPGRYLAIDYPVITSGNQCIPCGISFINMAGFGADNNDDGVGSSTLTTTSTAFSTVKRSVNQAERGVEIFNSQNATFGSQNLSGSNFITNYDLCNPEGGDKQCIDWTGNTNGYFVVYECLTDFEPSSGIGVNVQYYKGTTPASFGLSKVTTAGKTAALGWRWSGSRYVSCSSSSDLNAGCNGYSFLTSSLPNQFIRTFYGLSTTSLGKSYSYYGPNSNTHYFNGPTVGPIVTPLPGNVSSYLTCSTPDVVFTGINDYCNSGTSSQLSAGTLTITGPNSYTETINSGSNGTVSVIDPGTYTITPTIGNTPTQCVDCSRPICITITQTDIDNAACTPLSVSFKDFYSLCVNREIDLYWSTFSEKNNDHFIIEYSEDGKLFDFLAYQDGNGSTSSESEYYFKDKTHEKGYYRLLQYDFDGHVSILRTIYVDCNTSNEFKVFPNPNQGTFVFKADDLKFENADLSLLHLDGKLIYSRTHSEKATVFDIHSLSNGAYLLKIITKEGTWFEKIIKE